MSNILTFYNDKHQKVTLTFSAGNYWSGCKVVSMSISQKKDSTNFWYGLRSTNLDLTVLTNENSLYFSDVNGLTVDVFVGTALNPIYVNQFTVVDSENNMDYNNPKYEFSLSAVDRIGLLKYQEFDPESTLWDQAWDIFDGASEKQLQMAGFKTEYKPQEEHEYLFDVIDSVMTVTQTTNYVKSNGAYDLIQKLDEISDSSTSQSFHFGDTEITPITPKKGMELEVPQLNGYNPINDTVLDSTSTIEWHQINGYKRPVQIGRLFEINNNQYTYVKQLYNSDTDEIKRTGFFVDGDYYKYYVDESPFTTDRKSGWTVVADDYVTQDESSLLPPPGEFNPDRRLLFGYWSQATGSQYTNYQGYSDIPHPNKYKDPVSQDEKYYYAVECKAKFSPFWFKCDSIDGYHQPLPPEKNYKIILKCYWTNPETHEQNITDVVIPMTIEGDRIDQTTLKNSNSSYWSNTYQNGYYIFSLPGLIESMEISPVYADNQIAIAYLQSLNDNRQYTRFQDLTFKIEAANIGDNESNGRIEVWNNDEFTPYMPDRDSLKWDLAADYPCINRVFPNAYYDAFTGRYPQRDYPDLVFHDYYDDTDTVVTSLMPMPWLICWHNPVQWHNVFLRIYRGLFYKGGVEFQYTYNGIFQYYKLWTKLTSINKNFLCFIGSFTIDVVKGTTKMTVYSPKNSNYPYNNWSN